MSRPDKEHLFELIAQVAHAIANPHRLELLDLLVQAPRSVEQLATAAALNVANASQHLQRLKRAGLVVGERHGTTDRYRLADPAVARLWTELRRLALAQQADAERALDRYRPGRRRYPRISLRSSAPAWRAAPCCCSTPDRRSSTRPGTCPVRCRSRSPSSRRGSRPCPRTN